MRHVALRIRRRDALSMTSTARPDVSATARATVGLGVPGGGWTGGLLMSTWREGHQANPTSLACSRSAIRRSSSRSFRDSSRSLAWSSLILRWSASRSDWTSSISAMSLTSFDCFRKAWRAYQAVIMAKTARIAVPMAAIQPCTRAADGPLACLTGRCRSTWQQMMRGMAVKSMCRAQPTEN